MPLRVSLPTSGALAVLSLLALPGCLYKFSGGGFPSDVRTVAVLPFENFTADARLTTEVQGSVRDAVEGRLGLRAAPERSAHAVVRGTISRYEPEVPVAYTGGAAGQVNRVEVTRRMVQLVVTVEIVDQRTGGVLWQRSNFSVDGDYAPGQESDGRRKALDKLADQIVEGARSQW
jgi:hypothetical protein